MTDNFDDEPSDKPVIPQSEDMSEEIISTNDPGINTPNQETENMEVHKHPHHITHKKKWGEYLLEFFMLFLAVFLGFLAEYQLEHVMEHQREKEYIHSFIEDIKSDTLQSGKVLISLENTITGIDSLIDALASPGIAENSNNAYRLWTKRFGFTDFISADGTLQQLKNSGGLRLIRNKAVTDNIMKYDRAVRNYNSQNELMNQILGDQHIYSQLFDFINLTKNENSPVPLTEQGKKILNEAYANRKVWRLGLSILIRHLKEVNEEGKMVLKFIKEQYNFE